MTACAIDLVLTIDGYVYTETAVGDTDDGWFAISFGEAVARAILDHSNVAKAAEEADQP